MLVLGLRGAFPFPDNVWPLVKNESVDVWLLLPTPPSIDVIWREDSELGDSCEAEAVRENFLRSTCICLFPLEFDGIATDEGGCKVLALSSSESFDSAELDAATVSEVVVVELLFEYKLPNPSNLDDSLYLIDTKLAVVPML
jgi:hypothetical protein